MNIQTILEVEGINILAKVKICKNESMNQLTELINNQNNSKRIKSNLEKKLEMIALKKYIDKMINQMFHNQITI